MVAATVKVLRGIPTRELPMTDSSDPEIMEDLELLRRFLAGERRAHDTVERWAREIVGFRPYGIPRDEHDDVVQRAIGMLWSACSRSDFTLRTGVRGLVRKIVLARCIDHYRRRRPTEEPSEGLIDPRLDPEAAAIVEERLARVHRAIQMLDERCRDIIQLHFLDELPYRALSERMGLAPATVRVRMFHCMKEVRRLLRMEGRRTEADLA